MRKLEIIVLNSEDSILAEQAGADRLELVSSIEVGGLSPAIEMVKQVVDSVSIPVNVMIRFKDSDFVYNQEQMEELTQYILEAKQLGINGVVFGSLNSNGEVESSQLQQVIDCAGDLDVTYHRAIDQNLATYLANIEQIDGLVTNVLTSGGLEQPIVENIELLNSVSNRDVKILVGGGITIENYQKLFDEIKNTDFHVGSLAYNNYDFSQGINSQMISTLKQALNKK